MEVLVANDKLLDRARDELFSHINRCGVLHASPEDQQTWMTETIDYIAERYPDLGDTELDQLQQIGLRFCQPAISRNPVTAPVEAEIVETEAEEAVEVEVEVEVEAEGVPAA